MIMGNTQRQIIWVMAWVLVSRISPEEIMKAVDPAATTIIRTTSMIRVNFTDRRERLE